MQSKSLLRQILLAGAMAVLLVLALQPLFVGVLVFTRRHADLAAIRAHITQAYADGILAADEHPTRFMQGGGHQFTECTGLLLSIDNQPDPLTAALYPELHSKYRGPCVELQGIAAGHETTDRTSYARYWHGYRAYLWPMLSVFSLGTVRAVNAVMLYAATLFFFVSLRAAVGATPAAVFFIVLLSLTDIWRMWNITTHALSTTLILIGAAVVARLYARTRNLLATIVVAALFGALFNFIDFLINPPLMPMLFGFIVLATELQRPAPLTRASVRPALVKAGFVVLGWFGAYGLTWATEWALAIWMSPNEHQAGLSILNQIALRLYGVEPDSVVPMYPLVPTLTVIVQAFISVGSITVAILAAAMVVHLRTNWRAFEWRRFLVLISPTIVATEWFEILNNHTQTHSHFTYRSESAAIAIIFAAAVMATDAPATVASLLRNLWLRIRRRDPKPTV